MQKPATKILDPAMSPLFIGGIHDYFREYDGNRVGEPHPCPACGSTDLRKNGYQKAEKTFARLITRDGFEEIGLEVQQYECKECGRSFQGDLSELFYDGCEYAKPIVDLCRFHAEESDTFSEVEEILQNRYGLQVNRGTIQRYAERTDLPDDLGTNVQIGGSKISLQFLNFLLDRDVEEGGDVVITSHTALW